MERANLQCIDGKEAVKPIKCRGIKLQDMDDYDWQKLNELACFVIMLKISKLV